jgi:transmembrane sensor
MSQDNSSSISEQAAQWWALLHEGAASSAEKQEFAQWVARAPECIEAYLRVARVHAALSRPGLRWPKTPRATLVEAATTAPPNTTALPRQWARAEPRGKQRLPALIAVGVAAALLVAVGASWLMRSLPQQVQTNFGEQRSVLLREGSRVTLNTASKIKVRIGADRRVVELVQGEALFEIAPDTRRPFEVRVGKTVVRVLGTQFDVDQRQNLTQVTVVEGRVAVVGAAVLSAGDRALIEAGGSMRLQHDVNPAEATAWTRHQLIFERRPLGEIAAEFNRYNVGHIEIGTQALSAQELTGTFQSNDTASFVAFIAHIPGVRVVADGKGGFIVTQDQSGSPQ